MSDKQVVHVIDDDDALRDSVRLFLVNEGLSVRTYASATDFLDGLEFCSGRVCGDRRSHAGHERHGSSGAYRR